MNILIVTFNKIGYNIFIQILSNISDIASLFDFGVRRIPTLANTSVYTINSRPV